MEKYYTRVCNFYYGSYSRKLVRKKNSLPLNGNSNISFDHIEILSRKNKKLINIKELKQLSLSLQKKIKKDLKLITKRKKFSKINLNDYPIIMGVLNLTPDSFSDGGKYNKKNLGLLHARKLIKSGSSIIDIGGESTRPGAKELKVKKEWQRIEPTLKKLKYEKCLISLDTRKSEIMQKGIKFGVNMINDVSGLKHDPKTINILKHYKIPFVIHHMQGTPETMQKNPKYKNILLDIYDFFEKQIKLIKNKGISHNNIIIDPGIGFGKNLKHNITLISNISLFHSLGFPILIGISRKRFIKDLSGINDSQERLGGTISSVLFGMLQGVQMYRVHNVNEVNQSIKVFKTFQFN
jgi:dihydropteroate synthase